MEQLPPLPEMLESLPLERPEALIPFPTLKGLGLVLRPLTPTDTGFLFSWCSNPNVAKYVTWEAHQSVAVTEQVMQRFLDGYASGKDAPWGITLEDEDRVVGTIGLQSWHSSHRSVDMGYAIGEPWWGQGLASRAATLVRDYLFFNTQINRLGAQCEVPHLASARVMEKIGMQYEGTLRDVTRFKDRFRTMRQFSILRSDWEALLNN